MWVQSLGQEDLLEDIATHSSILTWGIPWTEEPGGLQSIVLQRVGHDLTGLAFKVKKLGNFRPAHYSLHPPHSQEREREKLIPFFFFFPPQSLET